MAKVKDIDKGWNKIMRFIKSLDRSFTKVGVQQGTPSNTPGVDMVSIAASNEFGTNNIPSRPFMANAFEKNKEALYQVTRKQYEKFLDGKTDSRVALGLIGEWYQAKIQLEIRNGSYTPNAPSTIAMKGSSKPLIDTGQLLSSIRHIEVIK